jgi:reversibly glycosylated polypeptide/UDP-arabinopyranose mutase
MRTLVVVPTCREDQIKVFKKNWKEQFKKHKVNVVITHDGNLWMETPLGAIKGKDFMGKYFDLVSTKTSSHRIMGYAYAYKYKFDYVVTLDDDLKPMGDTIGNHLKVLQMRVPISWMPVGNRYTRGFPYAVRNEAEVVMSHGVWEGVPDYDAPFQMIVGSPRMSFYKGAIPKHVYFPMCGMNLAFKRKSIPYLLFGHREEGITRFDDIFCGILAKREFDRLNWAVVTGYSKVYHNRLSNVFKNLQRESIGLELNETFWQGDEKHPYFKKYRENIKRWKEFLEK